MKVIKFPLLLLEEVTELEVPYDFTILTCQEQGELTTLWGETFFEKPREAPKRTMYIFLVGTGWEVKRDTVKSYYIGTVQKERGAFIWHLYWSWDKEAIRYEGKD